MDTVEGSVSSKANGARRAMEIFHKRMASSRTFLGRKIMAKYVSPMEREIEVNHPRPIAQKIHAKKTASDVPTRPNRIVFLVVTISSLISHLEINSFAVKIDAGNKAGALATVTAISSPKIKTERDQ